MQSDEQLMTEFGRGTRRAFDDLFERYRNPIYAFFRRRLDSPARAEDLAQEVFMVLIRDAAQYQPTAKFRTYIYAIAMKLLWTERRKRQRDPISTDTAKEPATETDPAAAIWIRGALALLDPDHREVLMLREYEQLSYDEIGETLGIQVNTVRSRLFRARVELKSIIAPQRVEEVNP